MDKYLGYNDDMGWWVYAELYDASNFRSRHEQKHT